MKNTMIQDMAVFKLSNICSKITWNTKVDTENCIQQYEMEILYHTWSVESLNTTNTSFTICNIKQVKSFRLSAYVCSFNNSVQWITKKILKEQIVTTRGSREIEGVCEGDCFNFVFV